MEDHEFGMNQAENQTIHCLIDGYHYSHTGVYDIFSYDLEEEGEQTFPIQIQVNERLEHTTKIYIQMGCPYSGILSSRRTAPLSERVLRS